MTRDPSNSNPNLPAWLRDQPLPPPAAQPASPAPTHEQHSNPIQAGSELPDWFQEEVVASQTASSGQEELPDWLRETPAADSAQLPDWLRETPPANSTPVSDSRPPTGVPENAATDDEPIPDWLRGLADDTAETQASPASALPDRTDEGVPNWLQSLADNGEPASSEAPSWLQPQTDAEPPDDQAIPTWLQAQADTAPADAMPEATPVVEHRAPVHEPGLPAPESNAPDTATDDSAVENWLRDIPAEQLKQAMEDGPPPAMEPFGFDDLGETSATRSAKLPDAPSWLGENENENTSLWFDAPISPPQEPTTRELNDQDAPDWLADIGQDQPTPVVYTTRDEAPDELHGSAPPDTDAAAAASTDDIPSWLRETVEPAAEAAPAWMRASGSQDTPTSDEMTSAVAETVPEWLGVGEPAADAQHTTPTTGDDIPDWLRDSAAAALPLADSNLPTWLRDDEPASPPAPAGMAAGSDAELPPWLRDESGTPLPTAAAPGEQDLPPWLKGAPTSAPVDVAVTAPRAPVLPAEPVPAAPALDWFADVPTRPTEPAADAQDSEFLGGTDLPVWLRQPESRAVAAPATDSRGLDWLTRLGSTDAEDATAPEIIATRLTPPTNPIKSQRQLDAIALLTQLATTPLAGESTSPQLANSAVKRWFGVDQLLYVLLLLALLTGILAPALVAPLQVPPSDAAATTLFEKISALGQNDVVLISYDWDARRVAELRQLEDAVIGQLITQKVKLVLMSTDPQGSLLLYDLRDQLNRAGYQPGGQDYILLGYQPGGELALRSLAQNFGAALKSDFQGEDVSTSALATGKATGSNRPMAALSDFSMIMLMADDQVDVQSWMEQVNSVVPQIPFATLLTAEAAPSAQPYLRQPNVYGLSGTGALAYDNLRHPGDPRVATVSGQLRVGLGAFATLFLLGTIIIAVNNVLQRRKA